MEWNICTILGDFLNALSLQNMFRVQPSIFLEPDNLSIPHTFYLQPDISVSQLLQIPFLIRDFVLHFRTTSTMQLPQPYLPRITLAQRELGLAFNPRLIFILAWLKSKALLKLSLPFFSGLQMISQLTNLTLNENWTIDHNNWHSVGSVAYNLV